MFQNRFDEFYLTICKEVGGIEGLLRSFFDFMIRKTDFFYEADPGDKMGFPPGYNSKLLMSIFSEFQEQHYKRFPKKSIEEFNKKLEVYKKQQSQKVQSSVAKPKQGQVSNQKNAQKQTAKEQEKPDIKQQQKKTNEPQKQIDQKSPMGNTTTSKPDLIDTYNGGKNQKYSWSQQSRQVEVSIQIEEGLKAKQLLVKMETKHISIKTKEGGRVVLEGELTEKINASESIWKVETLSGKNYLSLNLEKAEEKIWSTVFVGDPQIDTSKVNNTKPLHQFDDETQGAIRKIMYQQQRKNQGLPTTEEEKQQEALKKAWDAEGSPFKGTPFDPSKLNMSGFNPNS